MVPQQVARLVPLHEAATPFYQLPLEGSITIGRRTNCTVVLSDSAVSGLHCILWCLESEPLAYQAEDKSTNGIFINEVRVMKGVTASLCHGDVLALGKPADEYKGALSSVRPQFRLEVRPYECSPELLGQPSATSGDLRGDAVSMDGAPEQLTAPTSLDNPPAKVGTISCGASTAEGFAQDLLVQEQNSKAKITAELLLVRRRLDEERVAREALDRDIRKEKAILEDERARYNLMQEGLQRLQKETDSLRKDCHQLHELREEYAALESKQDSMEVELGALLQRATSLEAGQEHSRMDFQRICSDDARVREQLAEAQTRFQQAQERIESLQKKLSDARQSAETGQESIERWQRQLSNERGLRDQLEDQVVLLHADVDRALQGELAAKDALGAVVVHHADMQAQITKCRQEARSLRNRAGEAREKLESDSQHSDNVRRAGNRFVDTLRAYADCWARGLAEAPQALGGGLRSHKENVAYHDHTKSIVKNEGASPSRDAAVHTEGDPFYGCQLPRNDKILCISVSHSTTLLPAIGTDEAARPPVPVWETPVTSTDRPKLADLHEEADGKQGQQPQMASLMICSQDSPAHVHQVAVEKDSGRTGVGLKRTEAPGQCKLDTAICDGIGMQRLASTSILALGTPQTKRSMQSLTVGRKRLCAR